MSPERLHRVSCEPELYQVAFLVVPTDPLILFLCVCECWAVLQVYGREIVWGSQCYYPVVTTRLGFRLQATGTLWSCHWTLAGEHINGTTYDRVFLTLGVTYKGPFFFVFLVCFELLGYRHTAQRFQLNFNSPILDSAFLGLSFRSCKYLLLVF